MPRRWGIMGTGIIAATLLETIRAEGGEVVAVSSSSHERAEAFRTRFGLPRAHGRHEDLPTDPGVEVVYVATTNERHHLDVQACVAAGRAVLCEKPFALDAALTRETLAAARGAGVFVMEAMWMKLQPAFLDLRLRIAAGEIGEPRSVHADFGIVAEDDPTRRWFDPAKGGGALLDVGIYPLTLTIDVLGPPTEIQAVAQFAPTGVDLQVAVAMRHERLATSAWSCSFAADTGIEATVAGPEGSLRLRGDFHSSPGVTRRRRGTVLEEGTAEGLELRYRHEVREVHRCLDAGLLESPAVPHAETIAVMEALDEIRARIAPGDDAA